MSEKIGSFEVLGTLGTGAHSTILHIRRNSDSRAYALKIVKIRGADDQKFLDQAEHEFNVAQKLDHPNLIKVYALEKHKAFGLFGAVKEVRQLIEYVNGKTLDKFKMFPVSILLQVFRDVASGMVMMHRRSVCHADLKPNNIMLGKGGHVKVIDFGLAWIKGESKGRIQGTPEYMAPEQTKLLVNEKTDLFNLGATLYRLLTAHHIPPTVPLTANTVRIDEETWKRNFKPVRDRNPQCPPELAKLVEQCLAFKPTQRPESMGEVHNQLDTLVKKYVTSDEDELSAWEWPE
jgi:serine/threonine protein kinase